MSAEITVTTDNFKEEVLESTVPVLADFWAQWCAPCRMVGPILTQMAAEHDGKLKIVKVNVDEDGELASKYNIVSIPSILLFDKGELVKQQVGAVPRQIFERMVAEYID